MKQPDRLLAARLLRNRGECDIDAFFRVTPSHIWEEFKVASFINDSYDSWLESVRHGNKKPWKCPDFSTRKKNARRRLNGTEY